MNQNNSTDLTRIYVKASTGLDSITCTKSELVAST